ncbi:abhydrolase domain containing protein, partial [Amanita muscaria]
MMQWHCPQFWFLVAAAGLYSRLVTAAGSYLLILFALLQSLICIDILSHQRRQLHSAIPWPRPIAKETKQRRQHVESHRGLISSFTFKLVLNTFRVSSHHGSGVFLSTSLLMLPFLQHQIVYANGITVPLFADFDHPEKYGLAPNKTVNLKITTTDNETIGAWFVISDKYYHALPSVPPQPLEHMRAALERHPTILFLHGNAATRAVKARINDYNGFTSRLGVNVLAIDYRGFADSTGTPSEAGLVLDGRAAFDWLVENGAKPQDILIVGHSLGTGVTSQLVAQIEAEKISCRGVVLLAPFSSITHAIDTYRLFGLLPIPKPISGEH